MELKDIIAEHLDTEGISQRELSRRSGLSNTLISYLRNGINPNTGKKLKSDLSTYQKLASGMGMSVQVLFERMGNTAFTSMDLPDLPDTDVPRTEEAKLLAKGVDKLPKAQREKAVAMFKLMFEKADFNEEGEGDNE